MYNTDKVLQIALSDSMLWSKQKQGMSATTGVPTTAPFDQEGRRTGVELTATAICWPSHGRHVRF